MSFDVLLFATFAAFGLGILYIHTSVRAKVAALAEMTAQRDYWRGKTEQLMDAALVRAGAIHQPTMEARKPLDRIGSVAAMVSGALNIQEIDSTKGRKRAQ